MNVNNNQETGLKSISNYSFTATTSLYLNKFILEMINQNSNYYINFRYPDLDLYDAFSFQNEIYDRIKNYFLKKDINNIINDDLLILKKFFDIKNIK